MEGMPRLPVLSFQIKQPAQHTSFETFIKQNIGASYAESPDAFAREILTLNTLRASAMRCCSLQTTPSSEALVKLKRYAYQIRALSARLPALQERHVENLTFQWLDVNSDVSVAHTDPLYEMAAIVYNIGAIHSILASAGDVTANDVTVNDASASDVTTNDVSDSMKLSCTHFQYAAGAFDYIREHLGQLAGMDINSGMMKFHMTICLAQAQECILHKSMLDNRKGVITAKLAIQTAEYYREARQCLEISFRGGDMTCDQIPDNRLGQWVHHVELKAVVFDCVALLYRGLHAEQQTNMGERVLFFQAADKHLKKASSVAKRFSGQECKTVNECVLFLNDVVKAKLANAIKENEFIYHEKVPKLETLPELHGASLVKCLAVDFLDKSIDGVQDIFHRLVPLKVHEHASVFSAKKDEMLRSLQQKVDEKDQELLIYTSSLHLEQLELVIPVVLDDESDANILPQELVDIIAKLQAMQDDPLEHLASDTRHLATLATDVRQSLDTVESLLQSQEQNVQRTHHHTNKHTSPAPVSTAELRAEYVKLVDGWRRAGKSDTALKNSLETHTDNLRRLILCGSGDKCVAAPPEAASVALPSLAKALSVAASEESTQTPSPPLENNTKQIVRRMKTLIDKVNEMRRQRAELVTNIRSSLQQDDIVNELVLCNSDQSAVNVLIEQHLNTHKKQVVILEHNLTAQDALLRALTEANADYAVIRQLVADTMSSRQLRVDQLLGSAAAVQELSEKAAQGLEYYTALKESVSKLLSRTRSVCKAQHQEANTLPLSLAAVTCSPSVAVSAAPATTAAAQPSAPRLADYLAAGYRPSVSRFDASVKTVDGSVKTAEPYLRHLGGGALAGWTTHMSTARPVSPDIALAPGTPPPSLSTHAQSPASAAPAIQQPQPPPHGQYMPRGVQQQQWMVPTLAARPCYVIASDDVRHHQLHQRQQQQHAAATYALYAGRQWQQHYYQTHQPSPPPPTHSVAGTTGSTAPAAPFAVTYQSTDAQQHSSAVAAVQAAPSGDVRQIQYIQQQIGRMSVSCGGPRPVALSLNGSCNQAGLQHVANVNNATMASHQQMAVIGGPMTSSVTSSAHQSEVEQQQQQQQNQQQQLIAQQQNQQQMLVKQHSQQQLAQQMLLQQQQQQQQIIAQHHQQSQQMLSQQYPQPLSTQQQQQQQQHYLAQHQQHMLTQQQQAQQMLTQQQQNQQMLTQQQMLAQQQQNQQMLTQQHGQQMLKQQPQQMLTQLQQNQQLLTQQQQTQQGQQMLTQQQVLTQQQQNQQMLTQQQQMLAQQQQYYRHIAPQRGHFVQQAFPQQQQQQMQQQQGRVSLQYHHQHQPGVVQSNPPNQSRESLQPSQALQSHQHHSQQSLQPSQPNLQPSQQNLQPSQQNLQPSRTQQSFQQSQTQQNLQQSQAQQNLQPSQQNLQPSQTQQNLQQSHQILQQSQTQQNLQQSHQILQPSQQSLQPSQTPQDLQQSQTHPAVQPSQTHPALQPSQFQSEHPNQLQHPQTQTPEHKPNDVSSDMRTTPAPSRRQPHELGLLQPTITPSPANDDEGKDDNMMMAENHPSPKQPSCFGDASSCNIHRSDVATVQDNSDSQQREHWRQMYMSGCVYVKQDELYAFVQEVQRLENMVANLTKKSLNGPTLLDTKWTEIVRRHETDSEQLTAAVARCHPLLNRSHLCLPYDCSLVTVTAPTTSSSAAVGPASCSQDEYINCCRLPQLSPAAPQLLATQLPLAATRARFWQLVWQQRVELIVCLQNSQQLSSQDEYWPSTRGCTVQYNGLDITLQSISHPSLPTSSRSNMTSPLTSSMTSQSAKSGWLTERVLGVCDRNSRSTRSVVLLQVHPPITLPDAASATPAVAGGIGALSQGLAMASLPLEPSAFVQFTRQCQLYYWQQRNLQRPVLAQCGDGGGVCGIFGALLATQCHMDAGLGLLAPTDAAVRLSTVRRLMLTDARHLHYLYECVAVCARDKLTQRGVTIDSTRLISGGGAKTPAPSSGGGLICHTRHRSMELVAGGVCAVAELQSRLDVLQANDDNTTIKSENVEKKMSQSTSQLDSMNALNSHTTFSANQEAAASVSANQIASAHVSANQMPSPSESANQSAASCEAPPTDAADVTNGHDPLNDLDPLWSMRK